MTSNKRRRHTPDQIIRKLVESNKLLAGGQELDEECLAQPRFPRDPRENDDDHIAKKAAAMNESSQAELAKESGSGPAAAKGRSWTWQRCGRYEYRKCLTHSTNPDDLVPRQPSPTYGPLLLIATRYAGGRLRAL
jgi:hypothetical protein